MNTGRELYKNEKEQADHIPSKIHHTGIKTYMLQELARASKKRRWEETVGIMPLQGSEDPPSSANLNNGLLESNLVETQAISRGNGRVRGRGTGRGRGREGEGKRVSHFHLIIEAFLISQYYF